MCSCLWEKCYKSSNVCSGSNLIKSVQTSNFNHRSPRLHLWLHQPLETSFRGIWPWNCLFKESITQQLKQFHMWTWICPEWSKNLNNLFKCIIHRTLQPSNYIASRNLVFANHKDDNIRSPLTVKEIVETPQTMIDTLAKFSQDVKDMTTCWKQSRTV